MFCMCIERVCVGTGENKICCVCVLTEGALVQGKVGLFYLYVLTEGAFVYGRVIYVFYV